MDLNQLAQLQTQLLARKAQLLDEIKNIEANLAQIGAILTFAQAQAQAAQPAPETSEPKE